MSHLACSASGGAGRVAPNSGGNFTTPASASQLKYDLRVCTNKTCKGQGSPGVLQFARDLSLPNLEVKSCGCLGNCGNGPNLIIMPLELQVSHVATPTDMVEVLHAQCGIDVSTNLLKATEFRQVGNMLARSGNLKGALEKYTEGLELGIPETLHLLYSNRSGVELTLKDYEGALTDAMRAVEHAPPGFTTAYIRLIDAYYVKGLYEQAAKTLEDLIDTNPDFKKTRDYKLISKQLERDLRAVV